MGQFSTKPHQNKSQPIPFGHRLRFLKFLLFWAWLTPVYAQTGEILVDRVVASVDGKPILKSDVDKKVKTGPLVMVSEFPATANDAPSLQAMNDLINFALIKERAKELDIDISDAQLDQQLNRFLESRQLTREKLTGLLAAEGQSFAQYRADFKDQLIVQEFKKRVIAPSIKVTEKDVETFYLSHISTSALESMEIILRQILIKAAPPDQPLLQQAKEQAAHEAISKVKSGGMNFEDAVKIYSDDPDAREKGGLMDPLKIRDLSGNIRAAVENLNVGEVSEPVRTSLGVHIFFVVEKRVAKSREFEQKKQEIELELRTTELKNLTNRWLSEQRIRSSVTLIEP